jgi:phosphatidylglycerophosphate synthase
MGWVLLFLIFHRSKVEVVLLGKAAIASQLLLLAYVLLSITYTALPPVHNAFIMLTAGLTAISGLQYIYKGLKLTNAT